MSETTEKLGAHEVATWLRRHPSFLQQFPDLALTLVVPREDGPAASLASYQLEVLRDKNRELSRRLSELAANAQVNERLAVRTHQLTLALMKQLIGDAPVKGSPELFRRVQQLRVHFIDGGTALADLGAGSKTNTQWAFLSRLHGLGREAADHWLRAHRRDLGQRSSFDLNQVLQG